MPGNRDLTPVVAPLQQRFGAALAVEILPHSTALEKRYGFDDGRFFLVRPDGYVAYKARADNPNLLEASLARTLRTSRALRT
jgi:hypothetical protein